jgi:hypothetical protein
MKLSVAISWLLLFAFSLVLIADDGYETRSSHRNDLTIHNSTNQFVYPHDDCIMDDLFAVVTTTLTIEDFPFAPPLTSFIVDCDGCFSTDLWHPPRVS